MGTRFKTGTLTRRGLVRRLAAGLSLLVCSTALGCTPTQERPANEDANETAGAASEANLTGQETETTEGSSTVRATLNGVEMTIELEDNPAAEALLELLPLSVELSDLNGNEKYVYLDTTLPVEPASPGTVEVGDVMLFGDSCLVVFYESFATSYRYTRLGRVTEPDALAAVAADAVVEATFEMDV